jgi:hypothetical protein
MMTDCPNADVRDQLPDLVSGALVGPARAIVAAHVDGCADCRAEVALLTSVRGVLIADTPAVGVARIQAIVAALPTPPGHGIATPVPSVARRGNRMAWRIAATVLFMAVGGTVVVLQSAQHGAAKADSAAVIGDSQALVAATASPELALPGNLDSLSTEQLQSLLTKIDHLDGLPASVPDAGDPSLGGGERPDTLGGGSSRMIR